MSILETAFSWVLTTTWQASVLAILVLLAQWTLGSRLNPRWRHALWLLVVLRLLLPSLPESAFSVYRVAPAAPFNLPETINPPGTFPTPIFTSPQSTPPPHALATIPTPRPNYTFFILAIVWLSGALGLLLLTWLVNRRFARHVIQAPAVTDAALLKIFADAKTELAIRRRIRLVESTQVSSPAIMGFFTPTLLLPGDAREKFTPRELRYIFLHELAHLKRGDVAIQALVALLQIIHWFNPVLWYAFRRLRADREPATDALVLSHTGPADKEPYGLMLIKLLEHFQQRHALPTLVGILEDTDQFKRRFSLIARFTRGAYGWSLLGVLLIALLSAVCLTKAKVAGAQSGSSPDAVTLYIRFDKIGVTNGFGGKLGHTGSISDGTKIPSTGETLSVWCKDETAASATLEFIATKPNGPARPAPGGGTFQPIAERRAEQIVPRDRLLTFRIFNSVDVATAPQITQVDTRKDAGVSSSVTSSTATGSDVSKPQIEVHFTLVQIAESTYQQQTAAIVDAVKTGNVLFLVNLHGASLVSSPKVNTLAGLKAEVSVGKELIQGDKSTPVTTLTATPVLGPNGKITPSVVQSESTGPTKTFLGIDFTATPTLSKDGAILLPVRYQIGYIPDYKSPADFTTRTSVTDQKLRLADGQSTGVFVGYEDAAGGNLYKYSLLDILDSPGNTLKKLPLLTPSPNRLALIITARQVMPEAPIIPKVPTGATNAPHQDPALNQKLLALVRGLPTDKISADDADKLTQLLVQGADPNANLQPEGSSVLFTAAVANQVPVVKILLQHGGDPNHRNSCGNALIDWVLDQGHLEMATVLRDAGAKISPVAWAGASGDIPALKQFAAAGKITKGKTGEAMKYAVSLGQLDAVKYLEGIDGHPVAGHFLVQAAQSGNIPMLDYILKQGANIKTDGGDAMDMAVIFYDQPEAVKFLIAHGADPNRFTRWQDYLISSAKSAAMVKVLLEAGANPNAESIFGPAIALAPDRQSVQLFIQHGANLKPKTKNGNTLIESVISRGLYDKPDVVDELIKDGAQFDPKTDGIGELARAAWVNQVKTMQVLLDHGVDPNGYCDEPYMQTSVLKSACFNHSPDAVRFLLAHGANPSGDPRDEFSPLSFALFAGQWESADLLQQAGAHDVPALSNAAARGDLAQVTQLLKGGANPDAPDRTGNTPLHYAVRRGQLEITRLLLQHGANINLFNAEGITAGTSFAMEAGSGNPDQAQMDWGVSPDEGKRLIAAFKELFAQYPADFSYRNAQGRTLVHQMAATGNTMIELVIGDKAHPFDVNLPDHDGNTPLLLAATSPKAGDLSTRVMIPIDPSKPDGKTNDWNASAYIVNLLLKAGAKLDLKLSDGQTIRTAAFAAATKAQNPQLVSLLQATR